MLKIALVRYKAKCSRHPRFNPETDGPGAIHGNCSRCLQLQEIFESHRRTLQLVRAFGPSVPLRQKQVRNTPIDDSDRQQLLSGDPLSERDRPADGDRQVMRVVPRPETSAYER